MAGKRIASEDSSLP